MKISIKQYKKIYSVKVRGSDLTSTEVWELLWEAMRAAGFSAESCHVGLREFVKQQDKEGFH